MGTRSASSMLTRWKSVSPRKAASIGTRFRRGTEVPLTIAYGDERERGTGTAARRAQRYPRLFWQHENPTGPCYGPTQRAPATARVHTNYQVTHMMSTASCHVLIKSRYPIWRVHSHTVRLYRSCGSLHNPLLCTATPGSHTTSS